jgi:hypothetical protein
MSSDELRDRGEVVFFKQVIEPQVIGTGNIYNGGRNITLKDRLAVADEPSTIKLNSDIVVGLADFDLDLPPSAMWGAISITGWSS